MSFVKLAMACGLAAVTVGVSGCGIEAKPVAGTAHIDTARGNHAYVDDPRVKHLACLQNHGYHYTLYRQRQTGYPVIQIGTPPSGPTIVFEPTPGVAEGSQLTGQVQAAEVIGAALVYPNQASDAILKPIETCIALGVEG